MQLTVYNIYYLATIPPPVVVFQKLFSKHSDYAQKLQNKQYNYAQFEFRRVIETLNQLEPKPAMIHNSHLYR